MTICRTDRGPVEGSSRRGYSPTINKVYRRFARQGSDYQGHAGKWGSGLRLSSVVFKELEGIAPPRFRPAFFLSPQLHTADFPRNGFG